MRLVILAAPLSAVVLLTGCTDAKEIKKLKADVAEAQSRADDAEDRLDKAEQRLDDLESRMDDQESKTDNLPD